MQLVIVDGLIRRNEAFIGVMESKKSAGVGEELLEALQEDLRTRRFSKGHCHVGAF